MSGRYEWDEGVGWSDPYTANDARKVLVRKGRGETHCAMPKPMPCAPPVMIACRWGWVIRVGTWDTLRRGCIVGVGRKRAGGALQRRCNACTVLASEVRRGVATHHLPCERHR